MAWSATGAQFFAWKSDFFSLFYFSSNFLTASKSRGSAAQFFGTLLLHQQYSVSDSDSVRNFYLEANCAGNSKVSPVHWRFFGPLIYSTGNNPTIVAISSSIVFLAYHLQCLPGGSLTTHCVERCILYRSLLFIILVAIKSETVCFNRPSTSIFKHFLLY